MFFLNICLHQKTPLIIIDISRHAWECLNTTNQTEIFGFSFFFNPYLDGQKSKCFIYSF